MAAGRYLLEEVDPSDPSANPPVSLLEAAADLGVTAPALRHHLTKAGHPPKVEGGRAYLTIPVAEADGILRERRRLAAELGELPGWSAAKVAEVLGIRLATVYRLRELGKLPAAHEVQAIGGRKWRWEPETVRAYAKRVGRTPAE